MDHQGSQPCLSAGTHIDADHPDVRATARRLAAGAGSKTDVVRARFDPPHERLRFAPVGPGEGDLPGVLAEPLPVVVAALEGSATCRQVLAALPA